MKADTRFDFSISRLDGNCFGVGKSLHDAVEVNGDLSGVF
jgi:hypothetical protein